MERTIRNARGFTLIELLMVILILGLVMTAIYSVYLTHMRTAFSQEEVIDVQQNLRSAMDTISQDITMAGVMVPTGTTPIPAATGTPAFPLYSTSIRMTTVSADGRFARVTQGVASGTTNTLQVEPPARPGDPNPVDAFAAGDIVQVIQPATGSSGSQALTVASTNRTANTITFSAQIPFQVYPGDMLAKTADASPLPHSIDYYLVDGGTTVNGYTCPANQKCLVRRVNGTGTPAMIRQDIIASNITSLRFSYLDDSNGEAMSPADLTKIRAVRVDLQGATSKTVVFSGGARSREVTSIIKLRNRR